MADIERQARMRSLDPFVLQSVWRYRRRLNANFHECQSLAFKLRRFAKMKFPSGPWVSREYLDLEVQVIDGFVRLLSHCCITPLTGESPSPDGAFGHLVLGDKRETADPDEVHLAFLPHSHLPRTPNMRQLQIVHMKTGGSVDEHQVFLNEEEVHVNQTDLNLDRGVTRLDGWGPSLWSPEFVLSRCASPRPWSISNVFWCAFARTSFFLVRRAAKQQHVYIPKEIWEMIMECVRRPPYVIGTWWETPK